MDAEAPTPATPQPRILFTIIPPDPDPGAIVELKAELVGLEPDHKARRVVSFRDAAGTELIRVPLSEESGCLKLGADFVEVPAPSVPGETVWTAVLEDPTREEGAEPVEAAFTLAVKAHLVSVSVWDVPPAIERSSAFTLHVGVKCPHGCPSAGWGFTVHSHDGSEIARSAVGDEAWPGTDGLHFAKVALTAPDAAGDFDWVVTANGAEEPCLHLSRSLTFKVHAVPPPDFVLRVEVVDAVTRNPVDRARVVVRPYRAVTGADGIVELRLPAGDHTVFVSGGQYFAFKSEGRLTEDRTILAEMVVDREFSDADAWA
jgi:hypothetical protein